MYRHPMLLLTAATVAIAIPAVRASAQVEQITLRVDGLACPFCAYGLEKKLKAVDGFKEKTYKVKINEGKVLFAWRDGKPLNIAAIETAVDKAGFTLKGVRSTVAGKIAKQESRYILVLSTPLKQRFYLYEPQAVKEITDEELHGKEGTTAAMTGEFRERLDKAIQADQTVRIVGAFHRHRNGSSPAIGVEGLELIGDSSDNPTYNLEKRIKRLDGVPDNAEAEVGPREPVLKGIVQLIEKSDSQKEKKTIISLKTGVDDSTRTITIQSDKRADRRESYTLLKAYAKTADKDKPVSIVVRGKPVEKAENDVILLGWQPQHCGAEVILDVDELACQRCSTGVMRTVMDVEDVLHVEANHEEDRVHVWMQARKPDTALLRKAIEDAGFKVTRVHTKAVKDAKKDK